MGALAVVSAEQPAVERALKTAALDQSADRHVGTVVAAVGIQRVRSTVLAAKHRQVLAFTRRTVDLE